MNNSFVLVEVGGKTLKIHIKNGKFVKPDELNRLEGYNVSLKPAHEPILCFRKPVEKTFAHNAITHGVAGLNVDGARVPVDGERDLIQADRGRITGNTFSGGKDGSLCGSKAVGTTTQGRWPANLLLDHEAARLLDAASGETSTTGNRSQRSQEATVNGTTWGTDNHKSREYPGDSGGASRFFMRFHYSGKASKKERTCNGTVENKHCTVKPLSVMQYLCRLTATPTGGVVLDPFMGSGSTGIAAILEGREFIGIELERESFDTASARIAYHARTLQPSLLEAAD